MEEDMVCVLQAPHKVHLSEPGPLRLRISSRQVTFKACHMKISILGGIRARQIGLNFEVGVLEINLAYKDLTVNRPEAEWGHATESTFSESTGMKATRRCQSSNASGDRERRSQVPIISGELKDRDLRVRAVRKKRTKSHN